MFALQDLNYTVQGPKQLSRHIKQQWQAAHLAASATDIRAVQAYCKSLEHLCHQTNISLDDMHINAMLHGTAKVWLTFKASCRDHEKQQQMHTNMKAILTAALTLLQPAIFNVGTRGVSSMFWSFAKLSINPDILLPGTVNGLTQRFIQEIHTANDQSYATLLMACVELRLNPLNGKLVQAICLKLPSMDLSQFSGRHLANIVYSLVVLPSTQPMSATLLDQLCEGFLQQLQSCNGHLQPNSANAQDLANFAWALSEVWHVPSESLAKLMMDRMLQLCNSPWKHSSPLLRASATFCLAMQV